MTDEKLEAIFNTFNIDQTGVITPKNIQDAFSKFGREISTAELGVIFQAHDTDGEPGLSLEEFKDMMLDEA